MRFNNNFVLLSVLCFIILICGFDNASSTATHSRLKRMLHGKTGKTKDYPFVASLQVSLFEDIVKLKFCGGAILNERWILTAAHCFDDEEGSTFKTNYVISVGAVDALDDRYPAQRVPVDVIVMHPRYSNTTYVNDIAMLKLEKPLDFSGKYVQPIELPANGYIPTGNATILGWGAIDHKEKKNSRILKVAQTHITPNAICQSYYSSDLTDKQLCVGYGNKYMACAGDSGSPLVQKIDGKYTVIGVTSFGFSGCHENWPMVYTNVVSYLNFIHRAMREY